MAIKVLTNKSIYAISYKQGHILGPILFVTDKGWNNSLFSNWSPLHMFGWNFRTHLGDELIKKYPIKEGFVDFIWNIPGLKCLFLWNVAYESNKKGKYGDVIMVRKEDNKSQK